MLRHRLLDKLALLPSRHVIETPTQQPFTLETARGRLEIFQRRYPESSDQPIQRLIIKWPGNAGRAENSTEHPAIAWPGQTSELWTINPLGYGKSDGRASLNNIPAMAEAVWKHAKQVHPDLPILLFGTSIGCVTTLYQTTIAQQDQHLQGIILRNPPPLQELINGHYHRWFYGPVTGWLTASLSEAADSVLQATRCRVPMLMIQSGADTTVPTSYQDLIFDAYAGAKTRFLIPGAEHNDLPGDSQLADYLATIRELFPRK